MTNRQFRILITLLLYIMVSIGVNKKEYERVEEQVYDALDKAEEYNG